MYHYHRAKHYTYDSESESKLHLKEFILSTSRQRPTTVNIIHKRMSRLHSLCLIGHSYIYHPIIKSTPGATIFGRNMSFDNSYTAAPVTKLDVVDNNRWLVQIPTHTHTHTKGKGLTLWHKCTAMVPLECKETLYERIKNIKKIDTLHLRIIRLKTKNKTKNKEIQQTILSNIISSISNKTLRYDYDD
jgi:hypothetical protein